FISTARWTPAPAGSLFWNLVMATGHVRFGHWIDRDVRSNLPESLAMRALEEVEEIAVIMGRYTAGAPDIATHVSALPLNRNVRLAGKLRRFDVKMRLARFSGGLIHRYPLESVSPSTARWTPHD